MEYSIQGIHCQNCADQLQDKINGLHQGETVARIYHDQQKVYFSSHVDMDTVFKLLEFEKVSLVNSKLNPQTGAENNTHHHGHHHNHDMTARNTFIVFLLNASFAVAEFIFGLLFSSSAILADAIHDAGDAFSIGIAWLLEKFSTKEADLTYTFGYRRLSPLGALLTATILIIGSIALIFHATPQVFNAEPVNYQGMFWVGIGAIIINLISFYLMRQGTSQNEKLLSLHMMEDILGWLAVIVVSIILHFTDWYFLDPLLSVSIAVFILWQAVPSFIDTLKIFLETTPDSIDVDDLKTKIEQINGIHAISHLHVWSFDGQEHFFSVTIATTFEEQEAVEELKTKIRDLLANYDLSHPTIEVVYDPKRILSSEH